MGLVRIATWVLGTVVATFFLLGAAAPGSAASADDEIDLQVSVTGGATVRFEGTILSGGLALTDDQFDTGPASVRGDAVVPGAGLNTGTEAYLVVDVNRPPLFPVATGRIDVTSPQGNWTGFVLSPLKRNSDGRVEVRAIAISGEPFPRLVSISLSVADNGRTPGDHYLGLVHNGQRRFAIVHVPPAGEGDADLPVLLNLHGFLERHWMVDFFGETDAHADAHSYIEVYPQSTGLRWLDSNPNVDDPGFLIEVVDRVVADFGGDPARVYIAGLSNGGFYTNVVSCDLADRFGAAVSVVGYLPTDRACAPSRPIPITLLNGTKDPLVSHIEGREAATRWADLNGCDPGATVVDLPDIDPGDGTTVQRWDWSGCDAPVVYFEVVGGGHLWYGHKPFLPPPTLGGQTYDIDVNDVIWDFVSQFRVS